MVSVLSKGVGSRTSNVSQKFTAIFTLMAAISIGLHAPLVSAKAKPLGNPKAPQGGTFNMNLTAEPDTLNPITMTDMYGYRIRNFILDPLMTVDPETYEWLPAIAEKYVESPDGKTYTFTLREGATFHDGKPVTVEDVKFSFDVIFDPKFNTAHLRPYYENIEKAEVLDARTVKFTVKEPYFLNLSVLAETFVVPKHFYGDAKGGNKKNKVMMGSGPYLLEKYQQGQSILLKRNKNWWGNKLPEMKGQHNFEFVRFRFSKSEDITLEKLKKGEVDFYDDLTPEAYTKKTSAPEWGKVVIKKKVENDRPSSYGWVGWNLRKKLFGDRNVRLALYHLLNREEMNKKFRFGMSHLTAGPNYTSSKYADPDVKPVLFDPEKAMKLLKKSGWTDSDKNGILDKLVDGKKTEFRFTLNYGSKDTEKYWVLYQSDLKKYGIDMSLQHLEWNALLKSAVEGNFDSIALAWGASSIEWDPKQIWHSQSIGNSGSNYVGYNNPLVDKLIDEARKELDEKKRIPLLRKVYSMIAEDVPYAFLFNNKYDLYAHSAKIKMVKPTYRYDIGTEYWWKVEK